MIYNFTTVKTTYGQILVYQLIFDMSKERANILWLIVKLILVREVKYEEMS